MSRIILHPPQDIVRIHGILAYVSEQERKGIYALPYGLFKPEIKRLERELKEERKRKNIK